MKNKIILTNVTIAETPETDEIVKDIKLIRKKFLRNFAIQFGIFVAMLLISIPISVESHPSAMIYIGIISSVCGVMFAIEILLQIIKTRPYKKLKKIAKRNDAIRNDERIRFRERQRLIELMEKERTYTEKEITAALKTDDQICEKQEGLKLPQRKERKI
ncbi:MAG: hypothetical protein RR400_02230 [Clostridia bacterium]